MNKDINNLDPLILRVIKGGKTERPPFWYMRQAGRSLPEYRALREKHSMLELIRTPELATEVTLQPLRRFNPDGAIIFADILNPLIGMGMELEFIEGKGPVFNNPLKSTADIKKLLVPDAEENVGYTLKALSEVRRSLPTKEHCLLGFAGAPFTLSYYMIESRGSKEGILIKGLLSSDLEGWNLLQEKLVALVVNYLLAQVKAGAQVVQIFDTWLGLLTPSLFAQFVKPWLQKLVEDFKKSCSAPIVYYSQSSLGFAHEFLDIGFSALSVDWRQSLTLAAKITDNKFPLQGNLDPTLLCGEWQLLKQEASKVLSEGKDLPSGHIMNLGHGILPQSRLENIEKLSEYIRSYRYIGSAT
jgi:uroporphyrinogen decarboxylase